MKLRSTLLALAVILSFTSMSVVRGQATQEKDSANTTKSRKKKAKEADTSSTAAAPAAAPANTAKAPSKSAAAPENSPGVSAADISRAQTSGMVWVNTESGVYHKSGRYYGKTKQGKFMSESDAKKAGYRESKQEVGSKKS